MNPSDHQQICEAIYRYAFGIDTRNWSLYRSIFDDEVDIDFSSYSGRAPARMRADAWVASVQPLFTGLAATQHSMTNPIVTYGDAATVEAAAPRGAASASSGPDADTATCVMSMQAAHQLDADDEGSWFTIGGYYTNRFRRVSGLWRITGVRLTVLWRRGDPAIMVTAAQRGAAP
jgi:hypothetical protein